MKRHTGRVQELYESFPFPNPDGKASVKTRISVHGGRYFESLGCPLSGKRILDAGCGTGHWAAGLARAEPSARVLGVDFSHASLRVAEQVARANGCQNAEFRREDLLSLDLGRQFDVIFSLGVIHHLERPVEGLRRLREHLAAGGLAFVWLYHTLGEFPRMLDRELVGLLNRGDDFEAGVRIIRELGLEIDYLRYGNNPALQPDRTSAEVDAFLHPTVWTYRLGEALELFGEAGFGWAAILDLDEPAGSVFVDFQSPRPQADVVPEALASAWERLSRADRYRVAELRIRPTGFFMVGGAAEDSLRGLAAHVRRNAEHLRTREPALSPS